MRNAHAFLSLVLMISLAAMAEAGPQLMARRIRGGPGPVAGTLVSLEGQKLTICIASKDGKARKQKITINDNTRVVIGTRLARLSDLQTGQHVSISVSEGVATQIVVGPSAPPSQRGHDSAGSTI